MKDEVKDAGNKTIAEQARTDTFKLMSKLAAVIDNYFLEESIIPYNERFLVVSRAVNGHGLGWANHFWREMNPEAKMTAKKED